MRKIIHVDMDCFYAAIEVRDRPHLQGLPVAVGGTPDSRGVVATCNYEARRFGVRSAMSSRAALKMCPSLQIIFPNFQKYKLASRQIRSIFHEYTDLVEPLSLDEAFLDVTSSAHCGGVATHMAKEIRQKVLEQTGLTCSAGIAPNKFLAKIASEKNKPNGQWTLPPHQVSAFVKQLPVEKIFGVGKVTAKKMHNLGLKTCGDMQSWPREKLEHYFGSWGDSLYFLCRGEDSRDVKSHSERKSLSVETTFSQDIESMSSAQHHVTRLYEEFLERWQKSRLPDEKIKTVFVKIKFADFQTSTHERTWSERPNQQIFWELLDACWEKTSKPVRLIGLGVRLQSKKSPVGVKSQLRLFE